ncbi:MAG: DUF3179 domain-containing protein [Mariprofundaceae bacterium]
MHSLSKIVAALFCLIFISGFTLQPATIPADQIISGGPPKDGIPALTYPKHETANAASVWLKDDDLILGITVNKEARAYPIRIMNWHEIVNDRIGSTAVVITYCPLCGSGVAFETHDLFGVSGLLYQSDVLLYDHKTESLWSQLMLQAVAGPRAGEKLNRYPLRHTTWKEWKLLHPKTLVLSRHTGYHRNYTKNPYAGYENTKMLYFNVSNRDSRLHPKAWVAGIVLNSKARAWSLEAVKKKQAIHEVWQGIPLVIRYSKLGNRIIISHRDSGQEFNTMRLYWFAWAAFHPKTELYTVESVQPHLK